MLVGKVLGLYIDIWSVVFGVDDLVIRVWGINIFNNIFVFVVIDGIFNCVGGFFRINFVDIESILVLKDVLVVIYGVWVVNGVILVIIKWGKSGCFMV